jgi:addiction module HigA family antidote
MNSTNVFPSAVHPGKMLTEELQSLGVTPTELSRQIKVPPNRVTQIIRGQRSISGDTALRLGHWFGTSAQFWLNLQSAYDLHMAEQNAGREIATLPTKPIPASLVHSATPKLDHIAT